ncbi:MAG: M20 family metallo-hydrolase [Desulfovibrionaceae bacterium]
MPRSLLDHIDTQRDTVIDVQRGLVAIPALGPTNGGQGETEKAAFLEGWLRGIGMADISRIDAPDDRVASGARPNIAAVIPGADRSRTFWIISHVDVVPSGDLGLWTSPPFELRVDGDTLYGRGVEDNHQGIVASLVLAKTLLETRTVPPMNLGLLLVADEETGSALGLDHVLAARPDLFRTNDLFLVPDFGAEDGTLIEVAEKSMFWVKVVVDGRQCHASTPEQGVNSLVGAAAFIMKVRGLYDRFNLQNPLFSPPYSTFEPTRKDANVPNVNTIPGRDVFYIDCRVLAEYNLAEVMAAIEALGREVEAEHGVTISYEHTMREQAAPATPVDSDIVARLMRAIPAVLGREPRPVGIGGGTVAAFLRRRGYEAAVWSTCSHTAHQPNERTRISWQLADAKVMASALMA